MIAMSKKNDGQDAELLKRIREELEAEGEDIQSIWKHAEYALHGLIRRIAKRIAQATDAILAAIASLVINTILAVILAFTNFIHTSSTTANLVYIVLVLAVLFAFGKNFNTRQNIKHERLTSELKEMHPEFYPNIDARLERSERL
jgi:uncharacterized membrane protein YdbT with pleckstrin-like domain